jgi:hypothetical protein
LILNAHNLHNFDDLDHHEVSSIKTVGARSSIDQVSLQYILKGKTVDDSGGMLWSWRQFLTGRLFDTEGIWLPSRLIVIQGVLLGISIVLGLILLGVTEYAADEADKAQESLDQDLPTWVVQYVHEFHSHHKTKKKTHVFRLMKQAHTVSGRRLYCIVSGKCNFHHCHDFLEHHLHTEVGFLEIMFIH